MATENTNAVETFIQNKVLPEYRPIVAAFRKLLAGDFPALKEEMRGGTEAYYSVPVYRLNRIIITLSPTKTGITFAFSEGKAFEDKYDKLDGLGNKTRNVRLKSLDEFDADMMRYYIKQAIALDTKEI